MTSQAKKSSHREKRSSSESSNDSVTSEDENEKNQDSKLSSSSSDVTDLSGCTLDVDVEGDESPLVVPKRVRRGVASKQATGTSCLHDSVDKDETHTLTHRHTHRHTETMIRRPLYGQGAARTKDSYIEYTSQCTVVSKRRNDWNTHLVMVLALICAVCLVSLLGFLQQSGLKLTAVHTKSNITSEMFLQAFNSVRESFQMQTSGFWGVIRAAIKPIVFQENPDQPAVFVLVIPSDTRETSACFVRLFSNAITGLFQTESPVEFLTDTVSGLSPDRVKRLLDDQLRHGLSAGSRIAIVHHLEQLHGDSAMMLHAYCDNENAPFRRAIFILALFVDETSSEVAETETFVEDRLKMLWGDTLGTNKFYPLVTRIAHSIAFVRPETNDVLVQIKC